MKHPFDKPIKKPTPDKQPWEKEQENANDNKTKIE